ncbi:MAG: helix-turn-helix transcriptional regulator [Treponema sp.]|nr:helix-turn-helix transcriptional regulator [Treponema sp.]
MTRAYDKFFLPNVRENMGFAVDFAVNGCSVSADSFYDFFIASKVASQLENGSPHFVCGCSGTELALTVFERVGYEAKSEGEPFSFLENFVRFDRSPEYWAGWILAFYQWNTQISFSKIREYIAFSEIVRMYHPLHEAPEEKFLDVMNGIIKEKSLQKQTNLHRLRKNAGLTQKELSELSGVNLRTLQQYEIGAKDINRASGESINALARALKCNFYDVMELDLKE